MRKSLNKIRNLRGRTPTLFPSATEATQRPISFLVSIFTPFILLYFFLPFFPTRFSNNMMVFFFFPSFPFTLIYFILPFFLLSFNHKTASFCHPFLLFHITSLVSSFTSFFFHSSTKRAAVFFRSPFLSFFLPPFITFTVIFFFKWMFLVFPSLLFFSFAFCPFFLL